jgi:hypothetical protein
MYVSLDGCGPCVIRVDLNWKSPACIDCCCVSVLHHESCYRKSLDESWLAITIQIYMKIGLWNRSEYRR